MGLTELATTNSRLRDRVARDREALDKLTTEARVAMQAKRDEVEGALAKSGLMLNDNWTRQNECWAKIQELASEMEHLAQLRTVEVEKRMAMQRTMVDDEVAYKLQHGRAEGRMRLLDQTLHNCEVAEEVTDVLADFVAHSCSSVERSLRDRDKTIHDITIGIHERHHQQFRKLYLTMGELTFRKERNMEELQKKITRAKAQQEVLMDSLDPRAKEVADGRKVLEAQYNDMQDQVSKLGVRSERMLIGWKKTETALETVGRPVVNPKDELVSINEEKQQKLILYQNLTDQSIQENRSYTATLEQLPTPPARSLLTPVPGSPGHNVSSDTLSTLGSPSRAFPAPSAPAVATSSQGQRLGVRGGGAFEECNVSTDTAATLPVGDREHPQTAPNNGARTPVCATPDMMSTTMPLGGRPDSSYSTLRSGFGADTLPPGSLTNVADGTEPFVRPTSSLSMQSETTSQLLSTLRVEESSSLAAARMKALQSKPRDALPRELILGKQAASPPPSPPQAIPTDTEALCAQD
eukprot:NODE_581_length_1787_cov_56.237349_g572_i0.p1 GENE.NODE_581_length_1787_cov_56.237349_g572_i0~~NODE_581_length_1787_cov_56.237349_g572_i0.p1  ORF type:complete len:567 (+),score=172.28 NODE_581_length_1787_cov_56.237349_g572_i0:134-1702(+)